jgi:hypothetical protein
LQLSADMLMYQEILLLFAGGLSPFEGCGVGSSEGAGSQNGQRSSAGFVEEVEPEECSLLALPSADPVQQQHLLAFASLGQQQVSGAQHTAWTGNVIPSEAHR